MIVRSPDCEIITDLAGVVDTGFYSQLRTWGFKTPSDWAHVPRARGLISFNLAPPFFETNLREFVTTVILAPGACAGGVRAAAAATVSANRTALFQKPSPVETKR